MPGLAQIRRIYCITLSTMSWQSKPMTYSTVRFAYGEEACKVADLHTQGRCFLWCWSSSGSESTTSRARRWYDAHNRVQCVRLGSDLRFKFKGTITTAVEFCCDDNLHADTAAKAALRLDGFLPEPATDDDISETTEPESGYVEDCLGWSRGRGCPLLPPPGHTNTA